MLYKLRTNPYQLACILLAPDHKAPISKSYKDDSPDETEQEGVEVGRHTHVPGYPKQLTPAEVQKVPGKFRQFLSFNVTTCLRVLLCDKVAQQ